MHVVRRAYSHEIQIGAIRHQPARVNKVAQAVDRRQREFTRQRRNLPTVARVHNRGQHQNRLTPFGGLLEGPWYRARFVRFEKL